AGEVRWEILLESYLIPAAVYGYISVVEPFPQTDRQKGEISYLGMFADCLVPFFILLLIVQAMVGYVELGTDSWITKITGSILNDPQKGTLLFIYTSGLMFALRFFAGPIVHRISSLGLLFVSALIGCLGLYLIGSVEGVVMMVLAVTVYGIGKTFLWPTMLGVVGEQFPKSATVAMALLGCAGMTSAGLLGGPGIGYKQDRFASEELQELSDTTFNRYRADGEQRFLFFEAIRGLDGRKVGVVTDVDDQGQPEPGASLVKDKEIAIEQGEWDGEKFTQLRTLDQWWEDNKQYADEDRPRVAEAGLVGSRTAIKVTALVPAAMAVCYLLMILGFRMKGGYRHVPHD
ncbi:MAG: MFS transporter, partial [Planctomycetota bacterium]